MIQVEQPLVSVLMTSYNREKYIAEAIESVLSSTYKNFELIIVDDGSKDKTVDIALSYKAKDDRVKVYVNEKNLGDYPNRNKAASFASGKYIKFLDSDDLIYYYGLEVMVNYIERFPKAGFALAAVAEDEKAFPICIEPREIYKESFLKYGHFYRAPGSSIIKTKVFRKLGGFSGKRMIGDTEFWLKMAMYYPMVKMPFDLYWCRVHNGREAASSYAINNYPNLHKQVVEAAFKHPDCPLISEEKDEILNMLFKKTIKRKTISIIKSVLKFN